ncbi:MAG: NADH-quinone oxidoreductase subunit NuoK [Bdellovibrionaceae bacterium]|nr:NADH-quinone oxidoreductase subunit NuoK [Pseudobdellovibrionaceae bacterium]
MITIHHWLQLSLAIFSIGLYGVLTRRSAVGVLISVELMLNAGAINFVAFNWAQPARAAVEGSLNASRGVDGQVMAIFVIAIAAAEVMIGLAILVALFRKRQSVDVTDLNKLKY